MPQPPSSLAMNGLLLIITRRPSTTMHLQKLLFIKKVLDLAFNSLTNMPFRDQKSKICGGALSSHIGVEEGPSWHHTQSMPHSPIRRSTPEGVFRGLLRLPPRWRWKKIVLIFNVQKIRLNFEYFWKCTPEIYLVPLSDGQLTKKFLVTLNFN